MTARHARVGRHRPQSHRQRAHAAEKRRARGRHRAPHALISRRMATTVALFAASATGFVWSASASMMGGHPTPSFTPAVPLAAGSVAHEAVSVARAWALDAHTKRALARIARRQAANVSKPVESVIAASSVTGIPAVALVAYQRAANRADKQIPGCHISWPLLAGIGFIESGHAHSGGSGNPRWNGVAKPAIYGPMLNGQNGFPAFHDTDHGLYDANAQWDRAVGPMQFIPATWKTYAVDANHDGSANPQDIFDATAAAASYLCAVGVNLQTPAGAVEAVYAYNHSLDYVHSVLDAALAYSGGGYAAAAAAIPALPTPTPASPSPTPSASPRTSTSPSARRSPTRTLAPSPAPTTSAPAGPTSSPTPTQTATPTPTPSDSGSPTPTPSDSSTATPSADPSPSPTATSTP